MFSWDNLGDEECVGEPRSTLSLEEFELETCLWDPEPRSDGDGLERLRQGSSERDGIDVTEDSESQEHENLHPSWQNLKEFKLVCRNLARETDPAAASARLLLPSAWAIMPAPARRARIIERIENTVTKQLRALEAGCIRDMAFEYPNLSSWRNVAFDPHRGLVPVEEPILKRTSLARPRCKKYGDILTLLHIMWDLCWTNGFATKRDIYYKHVKHFSSQREVDSAVSIISCMLQIPRLQLRILATSKGLVAGSLQFVNAQGVRVDLHGFVNGHNVPQDVEGLTELKSDARFVLVVEKDATFQKILDEGFLHAFHPCILVTGKGVPDLNTRQLVHRLWCQLDLPVFVLVDADPFGIEIMCTYRFGSLSMTWCCERTAVPSMRWIGVHPSDFDFVESDDSLKELSEVDQRKLESLLKRPYVNAISGIKEQLLIMKSRGLKAEIQAFPSPGGLFQDKVIAKEWI